MTLLKSTTIRRFVFSYWITQPLLGSITKHTNILNFSIFGRYCFACYTKVKERKKQMHKFAPFQRKWFVLQLYDAISKSHVNERPIATNGSACKGGGGGGGYSFSNPNKNIYLHLTLRRREQTTSQKSHKNGRVQSINCIHNISNFSSFSACWRSLRANVSVRTRRTPFRCCHAAKNAPTWRRPVPIWWWISTPCFKISTDGVAIWTVATSQRCIPSRLCVGK